MGYGLFLLVCKQGGRHSQCMSFAAEIPRGARPRLGLLSHVPCCG